MLTLQYFSHLMQRANSLEKILMLGKTEGRRRRGQQRMRWLHGTTNSMDMNLGKPWVPPRAGAQQAQKCRKQRKDAAFHGATA